MTKSSDTPTTPPPLDPGAAARMARRRARNLALFFALALLALLIYAVTIVRIKTGLGGA